jgi:thioredoxin-like negative regulator of GroEL
MDRTTYKDKSAIQSLGQFVSVKQNIDKEGKKTAMKYDVSLLPTLIVLDSNGKIVLQTIGALDSKTLGQFLKAALQKGSKKVMTKANK